MPKAYGLTIQYAGRDFNPGKLALYINNIYKEDIVFPYTRSWSELNTVDIDIEIPEGASLKFVVEEEYSSIAMDYIELDTTDPTTLPTLSKFEGEDAKLVGGIRIENMDGASGGKITSYFQKMGDSMTFKRASAATKLVISYTRGNDGPGKLGLLVNGVRKQEIVFSNTGGWGNLGTISTNVDIPEGATIEFVIEPSSAAVNIDSIQLSK